MRNLYCRLIAALSFFTRLPFWRLTVVPKEYYERVVPLWPIVGYLTGGLMALLLGLTTSISSFGMNMPISVSILLALLFRLLVTGAIHEDGLADFCDGFGGGGNRQRILDIMKDSHIGTFGVLGLIFYYLLLYNLLVNMAEKLANVAWMAVFFVLVDVFCKWVASTIIYFLPYARTESESKNKLVYAPVSNKEKLLSFLVGVFPFLFLSFFDIGVWLPIVIATFVSMMFAAILFGYMNRKIHGYTGDCCGATFLICELSFYLILSSLLGGF